MARTKSRPERIAIAAGILALAALAQIPLHEYTHCGISWARGSDTPCTVTYYRPDDPGGTPLVACHVAEEQPDNRTWLACVHNKNLDGYALGAAHGVLWSETDHNWMHRAEGAIFGLLLVGLSRWAMRPPGGSNAADPGGDAHLA